MSENKKKFPLRWIIGILLVAAFEFYTWRNGRSVDDYGNVGPLDAISMLMMLVASSVVVFGIIFLITAIQKTLADKRREEAELAAAAQALEEVEQTLEELEQAVEQGIDTGELRERIDEAQEAVDEAQEAVEGAQDVVEEALEHLERLVPGGDDEDEDEEDDDEDKGPQR